MWEAAPVLSDERPDPTDPGGMLSRSFGLTPRETDVLRLVGSRYSNAEIAQRLGIAKRTVESHMAALFRKVGVPDRAALIRSLREAALLSFEQADAYERQRIRTVAARVRDEARHQRVAVRDAVSQLRDTVATQRATAHQLDGLASRWQAGDPQATPSGD